MNKDNAKDYLPLVQALADGKTIQTKLSSCDSFSDVRCSLSFGNPPDWYRIKPEPFECWVNIYDDGRGSFHTSEKEARDDYLNIGQSRCALHMREVE